MSPVLTKSNTKGDNNMTVTFENVYLLGSHSNRFVQTGNASKVCNVHISHEPLIWGKIDLFLTVCLIMRL